ncbi:hypothetical protein CFOL_v3_20133 [Cephalotus follicularis]|uniref:Uncharacterized protein n=1 Tax=Cephalotus follicularis TaxID=3775 RepID=A0A1Q3C8S2_CEPFO|nr:hypothetical protein CFOL_v3_20133 [Cephalotus follicularis]
MISPLTKLGCLRDIQEWDVGDIQGDTLIINVTDLRARKKPICLVLQPPSLLSLSFSPCTLRTIATTRWALLLNVTSREAIFGCAAGLCLNGVVISGKDDTWACFKDWD